MAYDDDTYSKFVNWLDGKYAIDLQRQPYPICVDSVGLGRWNYDLNKMLESGMTPKQSVDKINSDINQIVGLPSGTMGSPNPFDSGPVSQFPNLRKIKTDWLSGPFEGIDSAPSRLQAEQNEYLSNLKSRGYQFAMVDAESWNPNPTEQHPHGHIITYDALTYPSLIFPWLETLLNNYIVPIINLGTEGSPESWSHHKTNEWYWDNIGSISKDFFDFCYGHVIFLLGFEVDKKNADKALDRSEQWGWRGLGITSQKISEATGSDVYMHCNPESIGPETPSDNPWGWTFEDFWHYNSKFAGLFLQTKRIGDSGTDDQYYKDIAKKLSTKFHSIGKLIIDAEHSTMGYNEAESNRIGQLMLANGMDGSANG